MDALLLRRLRPSRTPSWPCISQGWRRVRLAGPAAPWLPSPVPWAWPFARPPALRTRRQQQWSAMAAGRAQPSHAWAHVCRCRAAGWPSGHGPSLPCTEWQPPVAMEAKICYSRYEEDSGNYEIAIASLNLRCLIVLALIRLVQVALVS